jgi:hypothetical protein
MAASRQVPHDERRHLDSGVESARHLQGSSVGAAPPPGLLVQQL